MRRRVSRHRLFAHDMASRITSGRPSLSDGKTMMSFGAHDVGDIRSESEEAHAIAQAQTSIACEPLASVRGVPGPVGFIEPPSAQELRQIGNCDRSGDSRASLERFEYSHFTSLAEVPMISTTWLALRRSS